MVISPFEIQQDTVQIRKIILNDSTESNSDSLSKKLSSGSDTLINTPQQQDSVVSLKKLSQNEVKAEIVDTTSVCSRNSIIDFTYYNPNNVFIRTREVPVKKFPFLFTEKNRQMKIEARTSLVNKLKSGQELTQQPLHEDWIIAIILIAAFLYALIRISVKRILPAVSGYFLLKGINDPSSRDIEGIFHWQSTIHNLVSFLIIGLFANSTASYYNINFFGTSGILLFLVSLSIIITAVTLRHIICIVAGRISGEEEVFREYLATVYQFYRFSAIILYVLVILISYADILPVRLLIITGAIIVGIIYLIRVFRLMVIFITHNISLFYLILYLCALEILPVLISVKYFAGLILG